MSIQNHAGAAGLHDRSDGSLLSELESLARSLAHYLEHDPQYHAVKREVPPQQRSNLVADLAGALVDATRAVMGFCEIDDHRCRNPRAPDPSHFDPWAPHGLRDLAQRIHCSVDHASKVASGLYAGEQRRSEA